MKLFRNTKHVSACAVERMDAMSMNFEEVAQSPRDIGKLEPDDVLILDANNVQLGETELALKLAAETARNGVPVGIHTYRLTLEFRSLLDEPLVVIAKTHRKVRAKLRRLIITRPNVTLP